MTVCECNHLTTFVGGHSEVDLKLVEDEPFSIEHCQLIFLRLITTTITCYYIVALMHSIGRINRSFDWNYRTYIFRGCYDDAVHLKFVFNVRPLCIFSRKDINSANFHVLLKRLLHNERIGSFLNLEFCCNKMAYPLLTKTKLLATSMISCLIGKEISNSYSYYLLFGSSCSVWKTTDTSRC